MDGLVLHVFKYEIAQQCRFIVRSAAQLDHALDGWAVREAEWGASSFNMWDTHEHRRYDFYLAMMGIDEEMLTSVWFSLQGLLVSAANVSKMLWGSKGERTDERADLRSRLGVQDGSVLESPSLRNDFEHIDERILRGAKLGQPFVGRIISHEPPGSAPLVPDETPNKRFGHFDPVTRDVTFWGRTANVTAIVQEAERLLEAASPPPTSASTPGGGQ